MAEPAVTPYRGCQPSKWSNEWQNTQEKGEWRGEKKNKKLGIIEENLWPERKGEKEE